MSRRVEISASAERDLRLNHLWWSQHRSAEQADRWFHGIDQAIAELATTADRHAFATEAALREQGVRQKSFTIGRRPTHRIVYVVSGERVLIYRVLSLRQDAIGPEDLSIAPS